MIKSFFKNFLFIYYFFLNGGFSSLTITKKKY